MNFNSIKVRLEHNYSRERAERSTFQFHKGTIRTSDTVNGDVGEHLFQFHKGTIRTCPNRATYIVRIYFNSIKVRLEPVLESVLGTDKPLFQFHKGTIRTVIYDDLFELDRNFNSIKVRLERQYCPVLFLHKYISIP